MKWCPIQYGCSHYFLTTNPTDDNDLFDLQRAYTRWIALNQCIGRTHRDALDVEWWHAPHPPDADSQNHFASLRIKRVFSGEALCEGLGLDLTLCQLDIEDEFRKDEGSWGRHRQLLFDHPEIVSELAVHLSKSVQDVGTLRAFIDCNDASVETTNPQGT